MLYTFLSPESVDDSGLSFWQSRIWKSILETTSQAREVFYFGNRDSTFFLVEIRSLKFGFFGAFVLGVQSSQAAGDIGLCIDALKKYLQQIGVVLLQIEPIEDIKDISTYPKANTYKDFLVPYTRMLDLSQTEDSLLQSMHEKGRYNIRLAVKKGVIVEQVRPTIENISIWMRLLTDTLSRDGFSGNNERYYDIFTQILEGNNQGGLYFARFEERVIAGGIFVFTPFRAIYYYGASSSHPDDRKQMAPYLIQWHAICEAKRRGIPYYDFLGVADPSNPDDHLRGVSEFKEKFGGERIHLPEKICIPLSWKGRLILSFKSIFKR